ncbi:MAG: pyridoxal-phosphate dependent enzyme [Chloroflexi bacterium]|nr:pyridoxal-phosphate dependent enzyme [Chloroflexota bacterium]
MAQTKGHSSGTATALTLGEGNTPLVRSRWIGSRLGLDNVYFKLEQTNPTGSYKDRFAARLISLLLAGGHQLCLAMSSGNTGAAVAAYAAAAGIPCVLCVPEDAPEAKLVQIRAYGARLLRVRGMVASPRALRATTERLARFAARHALPLGVSAYALSPEAMAGIEPMSAEIARDLGAVPDRVFCPVGGGGLLVATWRGFGGTGDGVVAALAGNNGAAGEDAGSGALRSGPRIHAVQPALNDTLVSALRAGAAVAREVVSEQVTRISGLGVPLDLDATAALQAVRASGGDGHLVEDERIWEMQALLARREGLYVEPAGAASVAGLWQAAQEGTIIGRAERIVCLLTGHGLKDEAAARRMAGGAGDLGDVVSPEEIDERLLARLQA